VGRRQSQSGQKTKGKVVKNFAGRNKEALMKVLPKGQYIKHFQYGLGVITASNEQRTSIDFDTHGMKKFVTSLMVVDPAEGTPPKSSRRKHGKKPIATPLPAATAGAL
jgi:hypothetical protein